MRINSLWLIALFGLSISSCGYFGVEGSSTYLRQRDLDKLAYQAGDQVRFALYGADHVSVDTLSFEARGLEELSGLCIPNSYHGFGMLFRQTDGDKTFHKMGIGLLPDGATWCGSDYDFDRGFNFHIDYMKFQAPLDSIRHGVGNRLYDGDYEAFYSTETGLDSVLVGSRLFLMRIP